MNSWFGYQGDPVSCAAYDMCILDEIEKEKKEKKKEEEEADVRNKIRWFA